VKARRATAIYRPASVGVSIPKLEGNDKVTGRAQYVDDLRIPGLLHGRTVRSTVPRGRITRVTLDPAFDWKGVTIADGSTRELLEGGWYFATEVARIVDGALTPEEGAALLRTELVG